LLLHLLLLMMMGAALEGVAGCYAVHLVLRLLQEWQQ
jgi:drug/metabolite transporter superfamily protein YnfA